MNHNEVRQWEPSLFGISAHHVKRYMFAANRVKMFSRVLDAACGCGYGAWLMHSVKGYVDAIDIEGEAIKYGNAYYPGPRYLFADLTKLSPKTLPYDMVVSFETIEHLKEPQTFLRALETDTLIASVPNELLYPFKHEAFKGDEYPHQRHYTPSEFEALLDECGFKVAEKWCQTDKELSNVRLGTDGKFLIFVAHPKR